MWINDEARRKFFVSTSEVFINNFFAKEFIADGVFVDAIAACRRGASNNHDFFRLLAMEIEIQERFHLLLGTMFLTNASFFEILRGYTANPSGIDRTLALFVLYTIRILNNNRYLVGEFNREEEYEFIMKCSNVLGVERKITKTLADMCTTGLQ